MATIAEGASSTYISWLQTQAARGRRARDALEVWLEAERDQLPLWLPVALGAGIVAWFVLPDPAQWIAAMCVLAAVALAAVAVGRHGRAGRAVAIAATVAALGVGLAWWRANSVAAPALARPAILTMTARVESVEPLPAREVVRLRLAPLSVEPDIQPYTPPRRRPGSSRDNRCGDARRYPTNGLQLNPGLRWGSTKCYDDSARQPIALPRASA